MKLLDFSWISKPNFFPFLRSLLASYRLPPRPSEKGSNLKFFFDTKLFLPTFFLTQNILEPRLFLTPDYFWPKTFFWPKIFMYQTFIWSQIFWTQNAPENRVLLWGWPNLFHADKMFSVQIKPKPSLTISRLLVHSLGKFVWVLLILLLLFFWQG